MPDDLPDLSPVLMNGFTRITLVGKEFKERITLDYDLTFASPDGKISEFPFLAIAELKRERHSGQSPIRNCHEACMVFIREVSVNIASEAHLPWKCHE